MWCGQWVTAHEVVAYQRRNAPGTTHNLPAPPVVHGWSRTLISVVIVVENMSDASTDVGKCFLYQDVHSDTSDPGSGFPQAGGLVPGYRA